MSPLVLPAILVVLAACAVFWQLRRREAARRRRLLETCRSEWGKRLTRPRDLVACRDFARDVPPGGVGVPPPIDDHTWADLDLDAVFAEIDRARSTTGQLLLCRMLSHPTDDMATLRERERVIEIFGREAAVREAVQAAVARIGFSGDVDAAVRLLWREDEPPPTFPAGLHFATAAAVLAVLAVLIFGDAGVLTMLVAFALNFVLHQRTRYRFQAEIHGLRQLSAMLGTVAALCEESLPGLEARTAELARARRDTRGLVRRVGLFASESPGDLVYEYLSILFLIEARAVQKTLRSLAAYRAPLRAAFLAVGELDALQAAASFRQGLSSFCSPEIVDGPPVLFASDIVHPLVPNAVPNSIRLTRAAVVTGSNMSGKSTFLRALGVNAILAQTIGTCTASRYVATRFQVLASLRSSDDLQSGKSLYWAEAERLLELLQASAGTRPTLCLVDEVLAGTNSTERVAAATEILAFMSARGGLVVSATHDLELAEALQDLVDCHHFTYQATAEGLAFDHRLRPGTDRARNAIRLLGVLGFPAEIVERAQARAEASDRRDA